jgi:hypothetical protein
MYRCPLQPPRGKHTDSLQKPDGAQQEEKTGDDIQRDPHYFSPRAKSIHIGLLQATQIGNKSSCFRLIQIHGRHSSVDHFRCPVVQQEG